MPRGSLKTVRIHHSCWRGIIPIRWIILQCLLMQLWDVSSEPQYDSRSRRSILQSVRQVKAGCAGLRAAAHWSVLGSPKGKCIRELRKACYWVERLQGSVDLDIEAHQHRNSRFLTENKGMKRRRDVHGLLDSNRNAYPLLPALVGIISAIVFIYLWETFFLGTTMFPKPHRICQKIIPVDEEANQDIDISEPTEADHTHFWDVLSSRSLSSGSLNDCDVGKDKLETHQYLRFRRCNYHAHENDGKAVVTVDRIGPCDELVKVMVKTGDRRHGNGFSAKSGKTYEHKEEELEFKPGETAKSFEIRIFKTYTWQSTIWFRCDLGPVTAGNALLYPQKHTRVMVHHDGLYPACIPPEKANVKYHGWGRVLRSYYFMKECAAIRGFKFWKTLLAMLYSPVHDVVVGTLVQKFIITYISEMQFIHGEDDYRGAQVEICLMGVWYFFSVCLLRWSEQVSYRNHGLTGGIRQTHRRFILDKMLIISHEQQMQFRGIHWQYTAMNDVESITMDIYWQFFIAAKHLFSLLLSFAMVIFWDHIGESSQGKSYDASRMMPSGLFLLVIPLTTVLIWRRRHHASHHLNERKYHEANWMETFSWLAEVGQHSYGLSYRELAAIEAQFSKDNAVFVKEHLQALFIMTDSVAISLWVTSTTYILIMIWGGLAILAKADKNDQSMVMGLGHYVLLLKLFASLSKFIKKLYLCLVKFQRGSVGLKRVMDLLNCDMKKTDEVEGKVVHSESFEGKVRKSESSLIEDQLDPTLDSIRLIEVSLKIRDARNGIGTFGELTMRAGTEIRFPLGNMVCVTSGHEAAMLSALGLAAGVVLPTTGRVEFPGYCQKIMLPVQPLHSVGDLTALEEMCTSGASAEHCRRLLLFIGINPEHGSRHLPPGIVQLMMLCRILLRDPEVLLLAKPTVFMSNHYKRKATLLLRTWQAHGGAKGLVEALSGKSEAQELNGASNGILPGAIQRTVIITHDDLANHLDSDVIIHLDEVMEEEALDKVPEPLEEVVKVESGVAQTSL